MNTKKSSAEAVKVEKEAGAGGKGSQFPPGADPPGGGAEAGEQAEKKEVKITQIKYDGTNKTNFKIIAPLNKNKLYIFNDNISKGGTGGSAAIRGQDNAVGIATGYNGTHYGPFFYDIYSYKIKYDNNGISDIGKPAIEYIREGLNELKQKLESGDYVEVVISSGIENSFDFDLFIKNANPKLTDIQIHAVYDAGHQIYEALKETVDDYNILSNIINKREITPAETKKSKFAPCPGKCPGQPVDDGMIINVGGDPYDDVKVVESQVDSQMRCSRYQQYVSTGNQIRL